MKIGRLGGLSIAVLTIALSAGIPGWAQMSGCGMGGQHAGHQEQAAAHTKHEAAHESTADLTGPHGGSIRRTDEFQFETVFTELGARIYVMDATGAPISPRDIVGTVTFMPEKGKKTTADAVWTSGTGDSTSQYRLRPGASEGRTAGFLAAAYNLESAPDGSLKAKIKLSQLPGQSLKSADWTVAYQMTPLFGMACPMHPNQASLTGGACSLCGGMKLQPARVLYVCCDRCPDMRSTAPATCPKCGMELKLKGVGELVSTDSVSDQSPMGGHNH